jgi:hypothetical protein
MIKVERIKRMGVVNCVKEGKKIIHISNCLSFDFHSIGFNFVSVIFSPFLFFDPLLYYVSWKMQHHRNSIF